MFTLDNGLTVVLQADRSTSLAAVHISYAVGAGDDPEGYRGLAHLAEHLTYGRTRHAAAGLLQSIDALGASSYNGTTSVNATRYYATVSSEALERALYYESERMAFGLDAITPAWLAHEQDIVCSEYADRDGDSPTGSLFDVVHAALYPLGHCYHAYGDRPDDVRAVTVSGAQWFVQRWYVPACATLAVVGNLDVERVREIVVRLFGDIPRRAALRCLCATSTCGALDRRATDQPPGDVGLLVERGRGGRCRPRERPRRARRRHRARREGARVHGGRRASAVRPGGGCPRLGGQRRDARPLRRGVSRRCGHRPPSSRPHALRAGDA